MTSEAMLMKIHSERRKTPLHAALIRSQTIATES